MAAKTEVAERVRHEIDNLAARRARVRARGASWDLDVAVFFFAVLVIVIILLFQGVGIEIAAPCAIIGLALGWLMGWHKGRQAYESFYAEELSKLERELRKTAGGAVEDIIEEEVQKSLRERWQKWQ